MKPSQSRKLGVERAVAAGLRLGLPRAQAEILARLQTPEMTQDFVDALPANFEKQGDTCLSVQETLRLKHGHCIEGAMVAACALWLHGDPPLLMYLHAEGDDDHVVTLFRRGRCWGAISKSNHAWLRWRDPIYRSLRELAMSYFHEYVRGPKKTLRRYSRAIDLRKFPPAHWVTNVANCWEVSEAVCLARHYPLLSAAAARCLRTRDAMEIRAGELVQYTAPDRASALRY